MKPLSLGALVAILLSAATALAVAYSGEDRDRATSDDLQALASAGLPKLHVFDEPEPAPEAGFLDAQGRAKTLKDYAGKIVMLNLWATWCGPCIEEMPALDRLAGELSGEDFALLPVSVDFGGISKVAAFYQKAGIAHLPQLNDPKSRINRAFRALGLPVTFILNRQGDIVARHDGPAAWDSPEVKRLLKTLIADSAPQGD